MRLPHFRDGDKSILLLLQYLVIMHTNRIYKVLLLTITLANSSLKIAEAQQTDVVLFSGKLENAEEKAPVSYAAIFNKTTKNTVFSDSLGYFSINAKSGDTLYISRIGFSYKELILTEALIKQRKVHFIEMNPRSYDLQAVTINNDWGTYDEFKYKIIHTPAPKPKNVINPYVFQGLNDAPVIIKEQASIPLGSPVTALYMLFSKEGKSLRKLEKLKEEEQKTLSYGDKYNSLIVSKITGFKDLELEKFMKFCNPDINFIMNATEVDITTKVLECLKNYNANNQSNENKPE